MLAVTRETHKLVKLQGVSHGATLFWVGMTSKNTTGNAALYMVHLFYVGAAGDHTPSISTKPEGLGQHSGRGHQRSWSWSQVPPWITLSKVRKNKMLERTRCGAERCTWQHAHYEQEHQS